LCYPRTSCLSPFFSARLNAVNKKALPPSLPGNSKMDLVCDPFDADLFSLPQHVEGQVSNSTLLFLRESSLRRVAFSYSRLFRPVVLLEHHSRRMPECRFNGSRTPGICAHAALATAMTSMLKVIYSSTTCPQFFLDGALKMAP